jgi:hypothetical protein
LELEKEVGGGLDYSPPCAPSVSAASWDVLWACYPCFGWPAVSAPSPVPRPPSPVPRPPSPVPRPPSPVPHPPSLQSPRPLSLPCAPPPSLHRFQLHNLQATGPMCGSIHLSTFNSLLCVVVGSVAVVFSFFPHTGRAVEGGAWLATRQLAAPTVSLPTAQCTAAALQRKRQRRCSGEWWPHGQWCPVHTRRHDRLSQAHARHMQHTAHTLAPPPHPLLLLPSSLPCAQVTYSVCMFGLPSRAPSRGVGLCRANGASCYGRIPGCVRGQRSVCQ